MIYIICHSTRIHDSYRVRNAVIEKLCLIKNKCLVSKFRIVINDEIVIDFYSGDYYNKMLGHHPKYHCTYNSVVDFILSIEGSKRISYDELMKMIDDVVNDELDKTKKIFYGNSEGETE